MKDPGMSSPAAKKGLWQQLDDWLDHRIGTRKLLHEALYERIPGGARWRYVWGSSLVFTFAVQVITGLFLWTAYSPSAQTAWESVYFITNEMFLGGVVRGIHHFAAQAMIVLLALHLLQVIIDGAYKAPREINFWLGLVLMLIVLGLSLTGYLLPWDQKGYYGTRVATNISSGTPLVGPELQTLAQGGTQYGHHTLTRFFALHAGILPGLLIAFLALHIYVFRRHGITPADPDRKPTATFWPDQLLMDSVACLAVLAVVMFLAIYYGAHLGAPANPAEKFSEARPEWYFLFLFQFLRFEAVEHMGPVFGPIIVPGLIFLVLAMMPLIARVRHGHKFNVGFTVVILLAVVWLTALSIYNDRNDVEHQLALEDADIEAERISELAHGPEKIPVTGAVSLLANDPFVQGPKIFAKQCAACHRWNGHDGRRRLVLESTPTGDVDAEKSALKEAAATASDLGHFGTREWMQSVLTDYDRVFAPLTNATWHAEAKENENLASVPGPDESEMAQWLSDNRETLDAPLDGFEGKTNVAAVVEYFARASGRHDLRPYDEKLADKGEELLTDGTIGCFDCHAQTFDEADQFGYPSLYKYGSAAWLGSFIADPGAAMHYGDANQMPAYKERMSERDLDLLARWMARDYPPTEVELPPVRYPDGLEPQSAKPADQAAKTPE
jgi:ubiquinol-cytochrome c reductase cytochrome b subunit